MSQSTLAQTLFPGIRDKNDTTKQGEPVGYRAPDTKKAKWDKAFVCCFDVDNNPMVAAFFVDGHDFISNNPPRADVERQIKLLVSLRSTLQGRVAQGWIAMTRDDIRMTAGV